MPASMMKESAPAVVSGTALALESLEDGGVGEEDVTREGRSNIGGSVGTRCVSILSLGRWERTRGPRLRSAGRMVVGGAARRMGRVVDAWRTVIHEGG